MVLEYTKIRKLTIDIPPNRAPEGAPSTENKEADKNQEQKPEEKKDNETK